MSIQISEIVMYKSTGPKSLGGAISATIVVDGQLHNLYDKVTAAESLLGETDYRCVYIKNEHPTITLEDTRVYIESNTASPSTDIFIGVGAALAGVTEQSIPDEVTAPSGINWFNTVSSPGPQNVGGIDIGDIPAGSYRAVWFKRVVDANTLAMPRDTITITVRGSTV